MSSDGAGEAINSLLKEIDDEMENTVNSDFEPRQAIEEESQKEKWRLPLQDIGDETMEMIVSHNTKSNINLRVEEEKQNTDGRTDNHNNQTKPLVPSRKSVVFSEGVNLHEYSGTIHDEAEQSDMRGMKPETLWKKSSFITNQSSDVDAAKSLINMTDSEPEEEESKEIELTTQDLQEHTITDLDKKLTHILDSKRNMQKLRQMAEEVDILARAPEAEDTLCTLNFILQPTQPLLPNVSNCTEESRLIQFEASENFTDDNDEQAAEEDAHVEYMNEILHSPSKIPLTNTVAINNFNRDRNEGNPQTRLSSGSSCGDSVAELSTTINSDRYKLLEYSSEIPSELCSKIHDSKESISQVITNHPNTSRVFSVATTVDGYRSAKETLSGSASVSSDSRSHDFHPDNSSAGSVEDLGISFGLEKDEETIIDLAQHVRGCGQNEEQTLKEQTANTQEISFQKIPPVLPQLPASLLPELASWAEEPLHYDDRKHSTPNNEGQYRFEEDEEGRTEFTGLHEVTSSDVLNEIQSSTSPSVVHDSAVVMVPISEEHNNFEQGCKSVVPRSSGRAQAKLTNEPTNNMSHKVDSLKNSTGAQEYNLVTNSLIEKSASIESKGIDEHVDLLQSTLPPISDVGSIFLDDPFGDECETSAESMDLTKSVKPSNYLSIWHMQADDIKSSSPAISTNSQFSQYSVSTGTSTSATGQSERFFKFKPRVVSRSRFYYPENRASTLDLEEEYIMSNLENALDPMRRNTLLSRKIQENIKSRRSIYPMTTRSISVNNPKIIERLEERSHEESPFVQGEMPAAQQGKYTETVEDAESENQTADLGLHDAAENLELLPCLSDDGLGEDFVLFLDGLDLDNGSVQYPRQEREGSYNIWDHDNELDFQTPQKRKSISLDVINKLLEPANEAEELERLVENALQSNVNSGILKTPIKEVSIGRGLSLKGYEATVTNDNESEQNSVMFNSFFADRQPTTPPRSPLRNTHVESPFKVLKSKNMDKEKEKEPEGSDASLGLIDQGGNSDLSGIRNRQLFDEETPAHIPPTEPLEYDNSGLGNSDGEKAELPDFGTLYLRLKTVVNLSIHGRKHHKARYAVEFDNGKNVVQTAWKEFSDEKDIQINKEFEIVLDGKLENIPKLFVTLKCRYEKPQFEIAEVVEKIPIGKKYLFGKSKFEYKKKYVQRPPKSDDWDYFFAQDGSFGRCEIALDDDFLKLCKFHKNPMSFDLMNEWARKRDHNHVSKKLYELPRRPAFTIGKLCIEACYLARTSPWEKFPKTLDIAQSIIAKYKLQQSISKEGYLMQEGGDVQGIIKRRFFKLQGNCMFGYHEITRQPKVVINLLKVVNVVGPRDLPKNSERNLTDLVLFGGCFHLIFENDEKITLSTESATGDNDEWYTKIKSCVELNKCHQPWVKHLCENSILTEL